MGFSLKVGKVVTELSYLSLPPTSPVCLRDGYFFPFVKERQQLCEILNLINQIKINLSNQFLNHHILPQSEMSRWGGGNREAPTGRVRSPAPADAPPAGGTRCAAGRARPGAPSATPAGRAGSAAGRGRRGRCGCQSRQSPDPRQRR